MDILYFLIQARVEPGLIDSIELAPTVQYSPLNYDECLPYFSSYFESIDKEQIRMDTFLSDEGGRFYKSQQRHLIIEIPEKILLDIPNNYFWLTYSQLNSLARFSMLLNIELRSMLSSISFI
jgi:oxidase EvaA